MKKLLLLFFIPFLFMTGCDQDEGAAPYEVILGASLSVDGDGHFKEDIVYKGERDTRTYKADGTYELIYLEYDNADWDVDNDGEVDNAWVPNDGQRGTYSYDSSSYIMTSHQTAGYENVRDDEDNEVDGGGKEWRTNTARSTRTFLTLFTEHDARSLYKKSSDGVWTHSGTSLWEWDNDDGTTGSWYNEWTDTMTVTETVFEQKELSYSTPSDGDAFKENESIYKGTIIGSYEDDINGATAMTYNIMETQNTCQVWEYDWDTGTVNLNEEECWDDTQMNNTRSYTYIEFDDFLVESNTNWTRNYR